MYIEFFQYNLIKLEINGKMIIRRVCLVLENTLINNFQFKEEMFMEVREYF